MSEAREQNAIPRFTPGPWKAKNGKIIPEDQYRHIHPDGSKTSVAAVWSHFRSPEEYEANCALIASAPDMYAAMQEKDKEIAGLKGEIQDKDGQIALTEGCLSGSEKAREDLQAKLAASDAIADKLAMALKYLEFFHYFRGLDLPDLSMFS